MNVDSGCTSALIKMQDHTALREASAVKEAERDMPTRPPPLIRGLGARKGKKTARMPSAHQQSMRGSDCEWPVNSMQHKPQADGAAPYRAADRHPQHSSLTLPDDGQDNAGRRVEQQYA